MKFDNFVIVVAVIFRTIEQNVRLNFLLYYLKERFFFIQISHILLSIVLFSSNMHVTSKLANESTLKDEV